jgi:hypothetical protein
VDSPGAPPWQPEYLIRLLSVPGGFARVATLSADRAPLVKA